MSATSAPAGVAIRPWVRRQFREHTGSALAGVFGGAAFDEVALELPVKSGPCRRPMPTRWPTTTTWWQTSWAPTPFWNKPYPHSTGSHCRRCVSPDRHGQAVAPAWALARPAVGRFVEVCSFGIIHPKVREMTGFGWSRKHEVEFAAYTSLLQLAWRLLPDRMVLVPLAHNRLEYEKIVAADRSVGLESFAP